MIEQIKDRIHLYRELYHHRSLADSRSLDVNKNKAAKYLVWFFTAFGLVYFIFIAVMLSLIANSLRSITTVEFICALAPFFWVLDFFSRFAVQQTPAQLIRPYLILPISKYVCIESFLLSSVFTISVVFWLLLVIPYSIMSVVFVFGFWMALKVILFFILAEGIIALFYLLARTLINSNLLWWIMPVAVFAAIALPVAYFGGSHFGIELFFKNCSRMGRLLTHYSLLVYLIEASLIALLFAINRKVQYHHIMGELGKNKVTTLKKVNNLSILEKLGTIGLFLQLEIKTIMRNKNPRKSFIFANIIVIIFSCVISFTDVYDNNYMANFWCIYNYCIYGAMAIVKIMCNEGNYIDGLMVRKENILQILHAKYAFWSLMLLLPFLLMLPTVFYGKWSLLMLISYFIYTIGCQYFVLFQLVVYNKQSQPLNAKLISKNGIENNYFQVIAQLGCMFLPVIFVSVLQAVFSDTVAYLTMLLIGMVFILTSKIWLRNIYNRFMKRRYTNLEGFRASR